MKGFFQIKAQRVVLILLVCFSNMARVLCTEDNNHEIMDYYSEIISPMERVEQEALYSALQGFVGNSWNGSDLYPDPCGWTPIQGVSCDFYDGLWYVSAINVGPVHDNSLICSSNPHFSDQLFKLKHLKALSFFSCFTVSISIYDLKWDKFTNSLESLEFRSNPGLVGPVPPSLGRLKKLQSLVLLENRLNGDLPMEVGELTSLRKLVLSGNHFVGPIPPSLGELTGLLILDLSRNNLSGSMPLTFGSMASLMKLDLSNNELEGKLPVEMGSLENLTLLDLGSNNFSGGVVWSFSKMVSLEEIVMSDNQLIGGDLNEIQWENLKNLEVLDLSNTGLSGNIPESIARMKRLRFLGLKGNFLSGKIPPSLASMPCIGAIYLSGNNLSGEIEFSEGFFRKFGGRFGAWENPNLCYNSDLTSKNYAPLGVKPCSDIQESNENIGTTQEKLNDVENTYFVESLGFSSFSFGGIYFVQVLCFLLLWHVIVF